MEERDNQSTCTNQTLTRRSFLKVLGVGLLGAPLIAACSRQQTDHFVVDIVLEQSESHFEPATLKVSRGSTVTWLNKSYYSQSVTCDPQQASDQTIVSLPNNAQPWDSGYLYPGQRFSMTFNTPGTYIYFSRVRMQPSTVGTIIVT